MNIYKLKINTIALHGFVLAILIFFLQIPYIFFANNFMEDILNWFRMNLPTPIKEVIKPFFYIIISPISVFYIIVSLASCLIFLTVPFVIIIVNLIALYLTLSAFVQYKMLTKRNQIIMLVSILIEVINIFLYLYIKSSISN